MMQEGAGADIEEIEYWLMWTMDKPKGVWGSRFRSSNSLFEVVLGRIYSRKIWWWLFLNGDIKGR